MSYDARTAVVATASMITFFACVAARAQQADTPTTNTRGATDEPASALEEVVVTARKRTENLQQTPLSITAVTAAALADRQIDGTTDLQRVTPNLQFSSYAPASGNNASSQVFIRGIGQTDFLASTDPGVGLYVDGVYIARSVGGNIDFADINRIEVLRGPQGTLFGRNTIGGAVNIITQQPSPEAGAHGDLKVGSDRRLTGHFTVDLPVSEGLLTSWTVGRSRRDGYVTRLSDGEQLGNDNTWFGRGQVLAKPTDTLSILLSGDYTQKNEHGAPTVFAGINATQSFPRIASAQAGCPYVQAGPPYAITDSASYLSTSDPRCANNQQGAGPFATSANSPARSDAKFYGGSATIDWKLGGIDLKSITAARHVGWSGLRDADNTALTIVATDIDESQRQFSQELQATGKLFADRLIWLLGLYHFDETVQSSYEVILPTAVGTSNIGGRYQNLSNAAFTQLNYDLTDQLSLTLGGRYGGETRRFTPDQYSVTQYSFPVLPGYTAYSYLAGDGLNTIAMLPAGSAAPTGYTALRVAGPNVVTPAGTQFYGHDPLQISNDIFLPMGSLSYKWSPDFFTYLTYSEGYKAGGHSTRAIRPSPVFPTFRPETAKSLEVGFKSDLFDHTVRLNGALFTTRYDDVQITVRDFASPIIINGGNATISGGELEWQIVPFNSLEIRGGLGYLHDRYRDVSAAAVAVGVLPGNRLPFAPDWSINSGISYKFNLRSAGTLAPRLDWSYQGKIYFDPNNTQLIAQPGYSTFNTAIRWQSATQPIGISAGVNNLLDKVYRVQGFSSLDSSPGYAESTYARGRTWFLGFDFNY